MVASAARVVIPAARDGDHLGADRQSWVSLDLVIPVWNEQDVLELLLDRLQATFSAEQQRRAQLKTVRYVFVDDGSRDRSAQIIAGRIAQGLPGVLYRLSRNFGHQNAVCAGLEYSRADLVGILDADLQDPPELIFPMVQRWREGYDVVYAQRRRRQGNVFKRAAYWLFYRLVALLADIHIPLDSGDFCLMDRRVVRHLCSLPEKLRFPRGLRAWVGYRQAGVEYDRPERRAGRSKYTLGRLYRLATDGVISSSVRPLQLAQVFSVSYLVLTLGLGLLMLVRHVVWPAGEVPLPVLIGYLLVLSGNFVQVLCIYILGAYVGRTYLEVKGRPPYVLMEVVGGGETAAAADRDG
jgi:polyisoprenyl-phosphate glycosyltransferase